MNRINTMKTVLKPVMAAIALTLGAGPTLAETYGLCVGQTDKLLPDNTSVPVWGYALGGATNGACDNVPTIPGPRLTVSDGTLTINLTNTLAEPTSVVVTGLGMPAGSSPTWNDSTTGARDAAADPPQRVRSFGLEAPAAGSQTYTFAVGRPGSFVYHSGTLPQKQVYMGLYGAVTQDAVAGTEAYPGVAYDNEVILFYSDIDPAHNAAVVGGTLATAIRYDARWFLVNGEPYVDDVTQDIDAGAVGDLTLLRFFSAASETHVPVLQGLHMTIHAEDGLPYTWQDGVTGTKTPAPREQWSVMLPPLKTADAIITPASERRFAVYDGNGYMTNPSDITDYTVGDTVGGMLRFLSVATAVNTAPVADAQAVTTAEDTPVAVTLTGSDLDGDTLTYSVTGGPTNGTLSGTAPNLTYTPNANYNGADSFAFVVNDGTVDSAAATVSITVTPVNDAPVADAQSVTTAENTPVAVTLTGSDLDGDTLTYSVTGGPTNGTLSGTAPNLTYTPNANYNGADSFTFVVNDGTVDSAPATVSITVTPVNDAPVADAQSVTTAEDTPVAVTLTGSDLDGDTLTFSVTGGPTNGTLSGTAPNLTYTPNANYNGVDSFTFVANDGTVDSAPATVSITVTPVNDAPVAVDDGYTTSEDSPLTVAAPGVLGNDTDVDVGDTLTAALVSGSANGTVVLASNGAFVYTPNANFSGSDTFTYVAFDGTAASNQATVTITVTPVNDAPVANAQSVTTAEDTPVAVTLTGSDLDGDTLTYSVTGGPTNGTLSGTAPNLTYTPNANYNGADSFTFVVNDGTVDSAAATVSITVTPVNDAPVAVDDAYTTTEDIPLTVVAPGVLGNDTDVDVGDTLTAALVSGPANGTVVLASTGGFLYTPTANFNGSDMFTYVAFDGTAASNQATVTITVTPVNDAPVVTAVADQTSVEGGSVSLQVTATDGDGDTLSYSATGLPPDLTINSATGLISSTVAAGASANSPYTVTVSVSDGTATTPVSFQWTVTAVVVPTDTLYFSTTGNTNPPGVTGTADDADIYRWDGTAFSRVVDASAIGVPANGTAPNVDGLVLINPTDFYVSFTGNVTLTGLGTVQDEDIVRRNNGAWSVYFDGTGAGLREDNQDIDAFDIVNGIIYFSTFGNLNPPGVTGTADDADIYRWNGGTSFTRVVDVTAIANPVPVGANVDALKFVSATEFYLSFTADVTLPGLGAVQDEDVVKYTNGSWSVYFDGTAKGLTSAGHDIDAVQLP